jgi:hypothetical protein
MSGTVTERQPLLEERHFRFLPLSEALNPSHEGTFTHYTSRWWTVHPEKGLAFYNPVGRNGRRRRDGLGSPQCNSDRRCADMVRENALAWPSALVFIASAWLPAYPAKYQS